MNTVLLAASGLTAALGLAHSVIGEFLIFRAWRRDPAGMVAGGIPRRHMRILWASWHLVTLFGMALAAFLYSAALAGNGAVLPIAIAAAAGGVLVTLATRGRHPGGIVLLVIAALIWWA